MYAAQYLVVSSNVEGVVPSHHLSKGLSVGKGSEKLTSYDGEMAGVMKRYPRY